MAKATATTVSLGTAPQTACGIFDIAASSTGGVNWAGGAGWQNMDDECWI